MTNSIITPAHMKLIDHLYYSPSERASGVNAFINLARKTEEAINKEGGRPPDEDIPSPFDILAFAVEYLGSYVIALGGPEEYMVELNRWFYGIHYTQPKELYGEPDRVIEGAGEPEEGPVLSSDPNPDPTQLHLFQEESSNDNDTVES